MFRALYQAYLRCRKHKRNTHNAVSLSGKTLSPSDTINKSLKSIKRIGSIGSSNFFTVLGLPTGCRALEGHSFNFAEQNSTNVPAIRTQRVDALPIGNLTSQYLRYVDDFVLFSNSKEQLEQWKKEIEDYLHTELGLKLRDDFRLRKNSEGLDFLGYIIRPYYLLSRQRVVKNFKQKKARYLQEYEKQKGTMSLEEIKQFLAVQASFIGHIKHANSHNLQKKVGVIHESNPFHFDRI